MISHSRTNVPKALGAACIALALGIVPAAAQERGDGRGNGNSACSCLNPSLLNRIYRNELRMAPTQTGSKHCAVSPTFLDMEQSVVRVVQRATADGQSFDSGVVTEAPEVTIHSQFRIYIDSNPNKPMGSCEIKTVRRSGKTRDRKVEITHQQAFACMEEIQASRAWEALCTPEVLKER